MSSCRLAEARLDSLRMQLRPHFLFNALHTISGLMENDPATGRRVVRQLGELLRMSLNPRDVHEVSLERELDFVRAYLEIEQVRFRERLSVSIDAAADTLRLAVPIFVLQPIVENAVRHGISGRAEGGRIEIQRIVIVFDAVDVDSPLTPQDFDFSPPEGVDLFLYDE